jgi:hypothetical protein
MRHLGQGRGKSREVADHGQQPANEDALTVVAVVPGLGPVEVPKYPDVVTRLVGSRKANTVSS